MHQINASYYQLLAGTAIIFINSVSIYVSMYICPQMFAASLVRRAIKFWVFWSNFLAYNTPALPLTEALVLQVSKSLRITIGA